MNDVLTVEETGQLLRISRGKAYQAVRSGEVPSIRLGRRILVPRAGLERLLSGEYTVPLRTNAEGESADIERSR